MELALQKAKEGGYDIGQIYNRENVLMNPLFWQALIKKEGVFAGKAYWLWGWHDFIDHLAEGKDADSFFKELINKEV